ncbi:hypothetical protein L207DRAFT_618229 [Hyaloscypha variabilis F]|uniref:Uncharacterized protein n=1 Tax=Hyaloscypha variabilis (strain UAMH 11265 / GT02V1 / F) TaxID=1149755 RepID=A0A2J6QRU7_HYAVF|nr:hypothetical protein L207DRAFT_618229 [Hyaloscypha variabilis F]
MLRFCPFEMFLKRQNPGSPMRQPSLQQGSTPDALPTEAKVGNGIGISRRILICIAPVLDLCSLRLRQYRPDRKKSAEPKPNTHEMITDSNRHELPTSFNAHEMEQEKSTTFGGMNRRYREKERQELDPDSRTSKPEPQEQGQAAPYELSVEPNATPAVTSPSSSGEHNSLSRKSLKPSTARETEGGCVRSVPDIVERIRVKKLRLKQLLEDNERRENLEKARRIGEEACRSDIGLSFDKVEKMVWSVDRDTSTAPE